MKKRVVSALLLVSLLVLGSVTSLASSESNMIIRVDDDTTIYVAVPAQYMHQIEEAELRKIAIIDNLKDGDRINIEEVGGVDTELVSNEILSEDTIQPLLDWTLEYETKKNLLSSDIIMKDDFVISVARGEEAQLTWKYKETVRQVVSGSYYVLTAEIKKDITCTYEITKKWYGPSENSSSNSREFRVKYLGDKYAYTQTRYIDGYPNGTKTGTVIIPSKYLSYSIDHSI